MTCSIAAQISGEGGGAADGPMDSLHIPLTGSPWFRPRWAEVGHGAGDKPLFVPLRQEPSLRERRGVCGGGVATSDDRWLASRQAAGGETCTCAA